MTVTTQKLWYTVSDSPVSMTKDSLLFCKIFIHIQSASWWLTGGIFPICCTHVCRRANKCIMKSCKLMNTRSLWILISSGLIQPKAQGICQTYSLVQVFYWAQHTQAWWQTDFSVPTCSGSKIYHAMSLSKLSVSCFLQHEAVSCHTNK